MTIFTRLTIQPFQVEQEAKDVFLALAFDVLNKYTINLNTDTAPVLASAMVAKYVRQCVTQVWQAQLQRLLGTP